jgi:hypothetical protein
MWARRFGHLAALVLIGSALAGCGGNQGPKAPVYGWGGYDDLVYSMYANPGEATPEAQISQLSAGIEEATSAGLQAGPGVYAHLGYMHYLTGNLGAAHSAFEQERTLYPESAVFVNGLLEQLGEG